MHEGMDVTFDCYTYPYSGTTITIGLPHWAKDGGPERLMTALRDPRDRERMAREVSPDQPAEQLAHEFHAASEQAVRRQADHRHRRDARSGARRRSLRSAAGRKPRHLHRRLGNEPAHTARLRLPPGGHDRLRCHPLRRVPESSHLRLLPHRARRVRPGRKAPAPPRSHPQDDIIPGSASRPS